MYVSSYNYYFWCPSLLCLRSFFQSCITLLPPEEPSLSYLYWRAACGEFFQFCVSETLYIDFILKDIFLLYIEF